MTHLLLTEPTGNKKLVNMALVSEAVRVSSAEKSYTNLVIPSAADSTNSLVEVSETPEEIDKMLRLRNR